MAKIGIMQVGEIEVKSLLNLIAEMQIRLGYEELDSKEFVKNPDYASGILTGLGLQLISKKTPAFLTDQDETGALIGLIWRIIEAYPDKFKGVVLGA